MEKKKSKAEKKKRKKEENALLDQQNKEFFAVGYSVTFVYVGRSSFFLCINQGSIYLNPEGCSQESHLTEVEMSGLEKTVGFVVSLLIMLVAVLKHRL